MEGTAGYSPRCVMFFELMNRIAIQALPHVNVDVDVHVLVAAFSQVCEATFAKPTTAFDNCADLLDRPEGPPEQ
jgi:hypothetical protein